jgi:caffeoyl-CoA O-methyltransferase
MNFLSSDLLRQYVEDHTQPLPAILDEIERYTHTMTTAPRMLSGPYQGRLLNLLVRMSKARRILEIGTFTGYSAICLALDLPEGGRLDTIDIDEEKESLVRGFVEKAGLSDKIHLHLGDACEVIDRLEGPFDFVFIDADKENYPTYFDKILPRMVSGGIVLADNTLWSGKVVGKEQDAATEALRKYNLKALQDPRVDSMVLPIRDGLTLSLVK